MSRVLVTGKSSAIAQAFTGMLPPGSFTSMGRSDFDMRRPGNVYQIRDLILASDRIVLVHGGLHLPRSDSLAVNLVSVVEICETALIHNPNARIVVMGSESARKGSFDRYYSIAKAALHEYVRNRKLLYSAQQLVVVSPSAVEGTGMTAQKSEYEREQIIHNHPKHRLVTPQEVAKLIHYLLFVDKGYITNTVIEMDGGKFAGTGL